MDRDAAVIVGGVSSLHDPLVAAALRGAGVPAVALPTPDAAALATGRALLARALPNPVYYLAGALVNQLRAAGEGAGGARRAFATVAGRFHHHAADYRAALDAAGLRDVDVLAPRASLTDGSYVYQPVRAVVRGLLLGDVLATAGCERRPLARDPAAVDAAIARARRALEAALAGRGAPTAVLRALRAALDALPRRDAGARGPRVWVVGDFFPASTDGEGGHRLVRWLEARGARVTPSRAGDWGRYLAWRAGARRTMAAVGRAYARYAAAAGVAGGALADVDDLAALAGPWFPTDLDAGAGFLEVGALLAADRDDRADLVVAVKPFASTPSAAVSDAVAHALVRRARAVRFVAVETTGDAEATVESRLELALDTCLADPADRAGAGR